MVRFYADEPFPFQVVELLRNLGHDVLTVQEAEMLINEYLMIRCWRLLWVKSEQF